MEVNWKRNYLVAEEGDRKIGEAIPAWFKWHSARSTAPEPAEMVWHQLSFCWATPVCWAVNTLWWDAIGGEHSWILVVPVPLRAGLFITLPPGVSPSSLEAGMNLRETAGLSCSFSRGEKEGFAIC